MENNLENMSKITITNEDCMELLKRTPDNHIDLVLTDPPFGMSFQSNNRKDKHKKIENDDNLDWLPLWVEEIKRVSKEDSHLYIFCSWHKVEVFKIELEKHFKIKNLIVWAKNGGGMGDLKGGYGGSHELCFFINNGKDLNGRRDSDVIKKAYRTGNKLHPTQKPINLMEYLIEKSSKEGDLVLDTFGGSFSVAFACHNSKRSFIGCELDTDYYNDAMKRLKTHQQQLTMF